MHALFVNIWILKDAVILNCEFETFQFPLRRKNLQISICNTTCPDSRLFLDVFTPFLSFRFLPSPSSQLSPSDPYSHSFRPIFSSLFPATSFHPFPFPFFLFSFSLASLILHHFLLSQIPPTHLSFYSLFIPPFFIPSFFPLFLASC